MTHAAQRLLAELLPPDADRVALEPDGIVTATLGREWLLAAWDDARGDVTVAAYTLPGGRCRHLWTGPPDAPHEASEALRAGGLSVRPCPPRPRPSAASAELTCSAGDALDLFSA